MPQPRSNRRTTGMSGVSRAMSAATKAPTRATPTTTNTRGARISPRSAPSTPKNTRNSPPKTKPNNSRIGSVTSQKMPPTTSNGTARKPKPRKASISALTSRKVTIPLPAFTGARRRRFLPGRRLVRRDVVEHETATDFLHRDPLGLVWRGPVLVHRLGFVRESRTGTAAQLLGAHRGDVDVEEAAFDGRSLGRFDRSVGLANLGEWVVRVDHAGIIVSGPRPKAQGLG